MATINDLLAAIEHVRVCTGDPSGWLTGLTPDDVSAAATIFAATPERLSALVTEIRHHHPGLFDPVTGAATFPPAPLVSQRPGGLRSAGQPSAGPSAGHQEGAAAEAIRSAEVALADQNSATAQLDLHVITAILNAHLNAVEGRHALNKLQNDVEAAVQTRTDLNTPAGARDFQRFLIGKLNEIRAVIARASLDDTSKSALMAAWTSLYDVSKNDQSAAGHDGPVHAATASSPSGTGGLRSPLWAEAGTDPFLDLLLADDPGLVPGDLPAQAPAAPPAASDVSGSGWPAMPGSGGMPGAAPGWGLPGGPGAVVSPALPQVDPKQRGPQDLDEYPLTLEDLAAEDEPSSDEPGEPGDSRTAEAAQSPAAPEPHPAGPTIVTLPDGDTVTAASPQLAAAIRAAANGAPISDAFRQQGIIIPSPGTAVTVPLDPSRVVPGDIGMFTDHHALALGRGRALLNGQIHDIATVSGPSFLGWEHPPAPATAPADGDTPTPTRPAVARST